MNVEHPSELEATKRGLADGTAEPGGVAGSRRLARLAGLLYLFVALGGGLAMVARSRVPVDRDPAEVADHLRSYEALQRAAMAGDLLASACWILTAVALYALLRDVHRIAAMTMVVFVAVGAGVSTLNQLNSYTALVLATDGTYADALGRDSTDALALLFTAMRYDGNIVDTIYFGLWLVPLGFLVIRSGAFPRPLGYLLIAGCLGYFVQFLSLVVRPANDHAMEGPIFAFAGLSELIFLGWLLIRGVSSEPSPARRQVPR
jgi:hypothetical protein